jgi:hypothetical protein
MTTTGQALNRTRHQDAAAVARWVRWTRRQEENPHGASGRPATRAP